MASVAIEEATGWVAGGRVGGVLLLTRLDIVATALGAFSYLFMEEAPPRVHTIFAGLREKKTSKVKTKNREKEEDEVKTTRQCDLGISEQLG